MSTPILSFVHAIKNITQFTILLSCLFLLGCLDLSDADSNEEPSSNVYSDTKVEGQAVNSVIENGIVRSYQIAHSEEGSTTSTVPFGLPTRTDKNGHFSFNIPNDIEADSILIAITTDEATQMTCDIVSGCIIKDAEEKVAFGDTFLLDDSFEITAMIPTLDHGFTNIITVNPLTHLASSRAQSQNLGPTIENINTNYRYIESLFGLNNRALQQLNPDLTKLDDQAEISQSAMKVAVLSNSFLALLNSPDWENISDIIHHAANRISISGTIAAANMGALPEVALDDLFYQANEIALSLLTRTDNLAKQNTLNKISLEVKASYELTTIVPEIIIAIEIVDHPASTEVDEGQTASFMVQAFGDDLSYQWRRNNTSISGANEATYKINKTSIENTGTYDVIVSNPLGSQVSLSALLTIQPLEQIDLGQNNNGTEQPTEVVVEQPSDVVTEQPTEVVVEQPSEVVTEQPIDVVTEQPIDVVVEQPIDAVVEQPTDVVTKQPQNTPPTAQDDVLEIFEDTPKVIHALNNDSDIDGDHLTITHAVITSGPGEVSIQSIDTDDGQAFSALLFSPEQDSNSSSTISYTINDGHNNIANAVVNLQIFPINDAPKSFPDTAEMMEDTRMTLDVLANDYDADNDTLTISSASSASGSVEITPDNTLIFEANNDFTGIAEINYIILDGHGGITAGIATVTVINVNDPPIAINDAAETNEDFAITISVLSNDSDGDFDTLKVTSASSSKGQVSINTDNTLIFSPAENYNGSAVINYTISDEKGGVSSAVVNLSILAVNDSPHASNDTAQTNEDTPVIINILSNDNDVESDALIVTDVHTKTLGGLVALNTDNTLTFVPDNNFNGEVGLSYTVNDSHGSTASASVIVFVNPVNDLPILANHQISTDQEVALDINVLVEAYDPDGDTLTLIAATAANGKVTLNDNQSITYQPALDFSGEDTISYSVSDGKGGISNAIITVFVSAVQKFYSIELNWEQPTKRDDGTLLDTSDIKGYSITYGMNSNQLDNSVFVSGSMSFNHVINNLNQGIHFFAIATVTQDDIQGDYSENIAVSIGQ